MFSRCSVRIVLHVDGFFFFLMCLREKVSGMSYSSTIFIAYCDFNLHLCNG